jgi:hypothetical protein
VSAGDIARHCSRNADNGGRKREQSIGDIGASPENIACCPLPVPCSLFHRPRRSAAARPQLPNIRTNSWTL